jgi:hypothetical protein
MEPFMLADAPVLTRDQKFIDDFVAGRLTEQQLRRRLRQFGWHDYEMDEHVDAIREQRRDRRRANIGAALVIALALALGIALRVVH